MARYGYRLLVAAGSVSLVVAAVLALTVPHPLGPVAPIVWVAGAVLPTYLLGAFALVVRPEVLAARWLAAVGSLLALQTAGTRAIGLLEGADPAWWVTAATLLQVVTLATTAAMASVFVLLPDSSFAHRYQRRTVLALWIVVAVVPVGLAVSERFLAFSAVAAPGAQIANPLFVPALEPLRPVVDAVFRWRTGLWLVGVVVMFLRYVRGDLATRRAIRWPLATAALFAAFTMTFRFVEQLGRMPTGVRVMLLFGGWVPGLALVAASVLVALLRHRLIAVDLGLRRSILHGGVMVLIRMTQLVVAGVAGLIAARQISPGAGVAVTLGAVAACQPLRHRLEGRARGWLFGNRVQGSELLRRVGRTLEDAYDTDQLAANLADTIADGLDLEWARVALRMPDGAASTPVAAVGVGLTDPTPPDVVVPMTHAGETVGFVECGPKRRADISRADEQLLASLAGQGALAVRNARLAAELESRLAELRRQADELAASRSRIVQAQLSERRRIERNIHDGVQQEIVALIAKLRLSRNQLTRDPTEAADTLADLQDDARRILKDLRELSRGIHPLVLTHRGLTEALDAQARLIPLDVCIDATPDVRASRFTEDVESTAYYVVSEGLTNVLKHAGTDEATVKLQAINGHLVAEVIDHGRGCAGPTAAGSGIVGLRDRVESIGGELRLDSRPHAGTTLRAVLPTHAIAGRHA